MVRKYRKKTDRDYANHKPKALPRTFTQGFLSALDGRTDLAKALRQNYEEIIEDVGGIGDVSRIKSCLVERFVWLKALLETLEHELALGIVKKEDVLTRWIQGVNTLSNLARTLGIEKKATARPWCNVQPAEETQLAEVSA